MENDEYIKYLEGLTKRLDALIFIMLSKKGDEFTLLKEQVSVLDKLNFRPKEIATILGRTPTHITKELTSIRKAKKKK